MKKLLLSALALGLATIINAQAPSYQWHSSGDYVINKTKIDNLGNIISIGIFTGVVDFDQSSSSTFTLDASNGAMFITKLDASGNFISAANFGSSYQWPSENNVTDICFTTTNNYVLTGYFTGNADFNPSPVSINILNCGTNNTNVFVLNLYDDLDHQSSFAIGGSGASNNDFSYGITSDTNDDIVITGHTANLSPNNIDFDPSPSTAIVSNFGGIFISKYSSSGVYQWAQIITGSGTLAQEGKAVFTNATNNDVLVMGNCSGNPDFDFSASTFTVPSSNFVSVFYLKLTSTGSFIDAKTISGNSNVELSSASTYSNFAVISTVIRSIGSVVDVDPSATNTATLSLPVLSGGALFTQYLTSTLNLTWAREIPGSSDANCMVAPNADLYVFSKDIVRRYTFLGVPLWEYDLATQNGIYGKSIISTASNKILLSGVFEYNTINYNPMSTNPVATEQGTSSAKSFYTVWQENGNSGFYVSAIPDPTVCANELVIINTPQTTGSGTLTLNGPPGWLAPSNMNFGVPFSLAGLTTYTNSNAYPPFYVEFTDGVNTIRKNFVIVIKPTIGLGTVGTPTITNNNTTLSLPSSFNGNYTWISCPSNTLAVNQPNPNTNNLFTPTQSGSYAAILTITSTGCKDTSDCVTVNVATTIFENLKNDVIKIYPNPTNSFFTISSENKLGVIKIINLLGTELMVLEEKETISKIDVTYLTSGVYFIKVGNSITKFIKQN